MSRLARSDGRMVPPFLVPRGPRALHTAREAAGSQTDGQYGAHPMTLDFSTTDQPAAERYVTHHSEASRSSASPNWVKSSFPPICRLYGWFRRASRIEGRSFPAPVTAKAPAGAATPEKDGRAVANVGWCIRGSRLTEDILDSFSARVMISDGSGRIAYQNRAADEMLRRNDGLGCRMGLLIATRRSGTGRTAC